MSKTTPARARRLLATIVSAALVLAGSVALPAIAAAPVAAADRTFAVVGSFQSELGCADDWLAECNVTDLAPTDAENVYAAEFTVPAGTYMYKVAVNDSWDENYGADGVLKGDDIPLTIEGPATLRFLFDDVTHRIGLEVVSVRGGYTADDDALAAAPVRQPGSDEQFYFVMTDRFANGDSSNDTAGIAGDRLAHGFDPTDKGFYNGGDIAGLRANLDYIKGLGTTAIWLTPSFKNRPVQGTGADASAGYHGYWITDFTQIDPHLGTNEELEAFIDEAHAEGIKVYFDIITNHTADVIDYAEKEYGYKSLASSPYTDADGNEVDIAAKAGDPDFPEFDPATSFPYTPVVTSETKVPEWLNDPTLYHNRGDSTYAGESVTYGDFSGLDDLMTENPKVVDGFVDVYEQWIDRGIDGFRIDTAKHVNFEFWEKWSAEVLDYARTEANKPDFFMFGEVYDADPIKLSPYVRDTDMNSVLDFTFQSGAQTFAEGKSTKALQALFDGDDHYTTPDSSATALPTFLGNHDMGRIGYFLRDAGDVAQRDELAHELMFLTRGQPVVYYGDEQGFVGAEPGNDKSARQTLFASQVAEYQNQPLVTGENAGSVDRYDTAAPLYTHIEELAQLRASNPALATGAQIERHVTDGAGVYAFSRVDREEKTEYLVALNNTTTPQTVSLTTLTADAAYAPLYGGGAAVSTDAAAAASVTVPALGTVVYKADRTVTAPAEASALTVSAPAPGAGLSGQVAVSADVADDTWSETSFAWRVVGSNDWTPLGTAEDTDPRVFHDIRGLDAGTLVEYRAVTTDAAGHRSAASTYASVGNAVTLVEDEEPELPYEPEPQKADDYDFASVPGSFNSELGCTGGDGGNWDPACDQVQMTLVDGIWRLSLPELKAGSYAYKIATDKSWDVNFGAGGVQGGGDIALEHLGGPITFYFDPRTKNIRSTADGPIITLAGSFQSELGCTGGPSNGDWLPSCLAAMMFDRNGDGTFQFTTDDLPTGSYAVKVTHGLSWDENYGAGGVPGGPDITFSAVEGAVTAFLYDSKTHVLTVASTAAAVEGVGTSQAHWIDADTIAWPATLGAGTQWQLYSSPEAGLEIENGDVTGGEALPLVPIETGLTAAQKERFPALADYRAVRVENQDRDAVAELLKGQLAVAQRNSSGKLTAFTGVQLPGVLDDLYADELEGKALGVSFQGNKPTFRLWAPTAQAATLLTWEPGATGAPERHEAAWDAASGTWSVVGKAALKGAEYLWEVRVYAPTTRAIETNEVTDPYSVALTVNSERSVAIDLRDKAHRPKGWEKAEAPVIDKPVDRTIYELHIRDFSITDESVPEAERGTYKAFTHEDSAGMTQLAQLAEAGMNTVHLLPSFDIATIEEDRDEQAVPDCDLESFAPASEEQQACIDEIRDADGFNWGYDPYHFSAPEGSYAVDPNGGARVAEFRSMVGALHQTGLQVVLDEVFNHTAQSGQEPRSVLDQVVPGYYHRLNNVGAVETSTCCQNVATEHAAAEKLMVDSVVTWARDYKVDGFRFDLMGHHSRDNMLAVRQALDELTVEKDGIDGKAVYLYGEGWNFGEVANNALFEQATQGQLGGTGIGTFNDRLRDGVHGGSPVAGDSTYEQGFGTGLETDPNGQTPTRTGLRDLGEQTDLVKLGLAGNLKDFSFEASDGTVKSGAEVDYNDAPAGYADEPAEVINYVDAHDNETLYDLSVLKLPTETSMSDRVRMNTVQLATVTLSQAVSFWHAGTELLRSKSLDRNSYNSGDWFNRIDWTGQESTFGSGLPMAADNGEKWDIMRPLLENPALKPGPADIAAAEKSALDLLRLRSEVDLLRLGSAELIKEKVSFPNGGADAAPGVITMLIDDLVGEDVDPELEGALLVFNASPDPVTQTVGTLAGRAFALADAQANGADAVVKTTTWDAATGTVTVPARSVAVLVDQESVDTFVAAAPNRIAAKSGTPVKVVGRILAADGSAPVGTVTVYDRGVVIATAELSADADGEVDIALPALGRGLHLLRTTFTGGDAYNDSRAVIPVPVLIW
ncbi:pullulanase-type alpha-1,6-glucosidase [Micromonospora sp. DT81.3]|uniref:pullulanase-type alpha-1,6-glucosidase n=1 Tax=Micromonospora sp. DT81.3 TaxID=3416523 RepID=UPI003CF8802F